MPRKFDWWGCGLQATVLKSYSGATTKISAKHPMAHQKRKQWSYKWRTLQGHSGIKWKLLMMRYGSQCNSFSTISLGFNGKQHSCGANGWQKVTNWSRNGQKLWTRSEILDLKHEKFNNALGCLISSDQVLPKVDKCKKNTSFKKHLSRNRMKTNAVSHKFKEICKCRKIASLPKIWKKCNKMRFFKSPLSQKAKISLNLRTEPEKNFKKIWRGARWKSMLKTP